MNNQTNETTKTQATNDFEIKSYFRCDLQEMYGIPAKTFHRWLQPFEIEWKIKHLKFFTPEQVRKIITEFGIPNKTNAVKRI